MPLWLLALAAGVGAMLFSKPKNGALTSAVLDNSPLSFPTAVNVVWDGSHWRPTGSEGLLAVQAWYAARINASLPVNAKIDGKLWSWDSQKGWFV